MNNVFLRDVLIQGKAMRRALGFYEKYTVQWEKIAALKPWHILFTGMGSSHYCSYPASIQLNEGGIPAKVVSASELLYYEMNSIREDTLLVLISQSGESGEIVDLIERLPANQLVIGITNDSKSALGRRANIRLDMKVENELAVSTRTYLASLILADVAANALLHQSIPNVLTQWKNTVDALDAVLVDSKIIQDMIVKHIDYPATLCYIARGPSLATAECAALFTRETAKYPALAFDSGEFRHGPFEMVDDSFRAMIFAPSGKTYVLQRHLAQAIAECGGKVVFVTDCEDAFEEEQISVLTLPSVPERFAPLLQIVPAQCFANAMALHLGHAPGVFRQSSKITTAQ